MSEDDRIALARLEETVKSWMSSTENYRNSLCEKISELKAGQIKVFEMLYDLPCKARGEMYKALNLREKLLWGAIGIVFAKAEVGETVK